MTSTPTRSDRGRRQDDEWADFVRELGRTALPFDEHWRRFHEIFRARPESDGPPLVWQPTVAHVRNSNIGQLMTRRSLTTYDDLYHWSIDDQVGFWGEIIENLEIAFATPPSAVIDQSHGAKDPRWLPDATLNCVDSCFLAGKVVYVVLDRAYDTEQLKAELGGRLSTQINPLFKISDLLVRDTLPRTASNKLTRRVLRDQYSRQP